MAMALNLPLKIEQKIILRGVSWELYEHILSNFEDSHAAHFAYDEGALEIMVLSPEHERFKQTIATLVEEVAVELDIDIDGLGSTTFRRDDLSKGFEADACFYVQHAERMRKKKRIDLHQDPPPDLVIEIDITSPSLDKFPIFAAIGVAEVWRYDGKRLSIFRLQGAKYKEVQESKTLPGVTSVALTTFLRDSQNLKRTEWLRHLREWARDLSKAHSPAK